MADSPASRNGITLLEACADEQLLNFGAYPGQLELLRAIEHNSMVVASCGRRSGKTRCAAAAALWNLLLVPQLDDMVGRNEKRFGISIGNNREQAAIFVDHARSLVEASPILANKLVSSKEFELVFSGGRHLIAFPCSSRSGRGYAASFLLLDEFAHHVDSTDGPGVAAKIYAAMTPGLAQFGALGRLVVASTPYGENLFSELHQRARNGELSGAVAFHGTTARMNPGVSDSFLEGQRVALGEDDFAREFQAAWTSGGSSFLERERLFAAVEDRRELPPSAGRRWICGVDASFSRDPTGIACVGVDVDDPDRLVLGSTGRWVPERVRKQRKTREDIDRAMGEVLNAVAEIAKRYDAICVLDQHMPHVVEDELRKRGVRHVTVSAWSATSRTDAFSAVRARIYTSRLRLYDDGNLIAELLRLRSKYRAGAGIVEVPRTGDSHGDQACALAAAVWEHDRDALVRTGNALPRAGGEAICTGLLDMDFGTGRHRSTRPSRWYDRSTSIGDRIF